MVTPLNLPPGAQEFQTLCTASAQFGHKAELKLARADRWAHPFGQRARFISNLDWPRLRLGLSFVRNSCVVL
jgi:hypothetical protein